jgi:uncharacterized protein (DUF1697 family)
MRDHAIGWSSGTSGARLPRIALVRGVNVGGHNRLPMAALRSLCGELGWTDVRTYIASGNVVFREAGPSPALESDLERAIGHRFGLDVAVVVRDAEVWKELVETNPFFDVASAEPNRVALVLSKHPPRPDALAGLLERAADGERVARVGDAIWIHFPGGAGRSRLSPSAIERLVGSPVTARNWRTVRTLGEMAGKPSGG